MKIQPKLVKTVRIREDRAQRLKDKAFEISMEAGEKITEANLINYLIDKELDSLSIEKSTMKIKRLNQKND